MMEFLLIFMALLCRYKLVSSWILNICNSWQVCKDQRLTMSRKPQLLYWNLKLAFTFDHTLETVVKSRGGHWGPKWFTFCMLPGYGSRNLHVSSSALICRFLCSWAWNVQITGAITNRPRREPYFLSSHTLYLTSQRTKPSDFWCFGILKVNKDHCKRNGAISLSGWRDMQINVPFPLESTHQGYRCTTCAF